MVQQSITDNTFETPRLTRDIYALSVGERLELLCKVGHALDPNEIGGEPSDGLRDGNLL